ncbi:hypothetical protein BH09SUM1_BH09SUM1_14420 [soil metagenome]
MKAGTAVVRRLPLCPFHARPTLIGRSKDVPQATDIGPPFLHPRRDPYLRRARHVAALTLAVVHGLWFAAMIAAAQRQLLPSEPLVILAVVGVLLVGARSALVAELALGIQDVRAKMHNAPSSKEIATRAAVGLALPLAVLWIAFLVRVGTTGAILSAAGIVACQLVYRLGGFSRWEKTPIYFPTLKKLLTANVEEALQELSEAPIESGAVEEVSALALAGVAMRESKPAMVARLEEMLAQRISRFAPEQRHSIERAGAIVHADYARLVDPANCSVEEARALTVTPAGHPRRLALSLFVATAAMEQGDFESSLKALRLLHSRDVMSNSARVLVDWLAKESAGQTGDAAYVEKCRLALRTFDLRREAGAMVVDKLRGESDPYARWICRAREGLLKDQGRRMKDEIGREKG